MLAKYSRWTKRLPPMQRAKAEAVLALESLERYDKAVKRVKKRSEGLWQRFVKYPGDHNLAVFKRYNRLVRNPLFRQAGVRRDRVARLMDSVHMDETLPYPRIGVPRSLKDEYSPIERLLGYNRKSMQPKIAPPRKKLTYMPKPGKLPKDIPPPPLTAKQQAYRSWRSLRSFLSKYRKPLLIGATGAAAVGTGLLAFTSDRHKKLRGKS